MTPNQSRGPHLLLRSGLWFPYDPRVEDVRLCDMAPLATLYRYGGQWGPYSVAEHSVRVCQALRDAGFDRRVQLAGLIHDAHEYLSPGDVPSPVKSPARSKQFSADVSPTDLLAANRYRIASAIVDLENMAQAVVRQFFGFTEENWPEEPVHEADLALCATEARDICGARIESERDCAIWGRGLLKMALPSVRIEQPFWSPKFAWSMFCNELATLWRSDAAEMAGAL